MPPEEPPMFSARPASSLSRARGCAREREGRAACVVDHHFLAPSILGSLDTQGSPVSKGSIFFFTQPKVTLSQHTLDHVYHYHHYLLSLGSLVHWFSY